MMNRLLSSLAEVCAEHPLDKKYLIVPSFQIGRQLGDGLAAAGASWVNLHYLTLPALAEQVAGPELAAKGTRVISGADALSLVDRIFGQHKDAGRLGYFGRVEATVGTIRALQASISALRMAGLKSGALDPSSFINETKGREVVLFMRSFEEELEKANLVDLPGVYELASKIVAACRKHRAGHRPGPEERELFIAFRERPLGAIERQFLLGIAGDNLVLLPQDPVFGLVRPRRLWDQKAAPAAAAPAAPDAGAPLFSWLFAAQDAPGMPPALLPAGAAIDIFSSVGPTNECREILRRLLAGGIPFDEVEIVHPPEPTYPSIMHALAAKSGLPIALADGLPVAFTAPGKAFFGLLEWLKHDYLVSDLCALIEAGAVALPRGDGAPAISPLKASRYLKRAMIGWGRERYAERLRALLPESGNSAECSPDIDDELGQAPPPPETGPELRSLVAFIEEILALFPAAGDDGKLDYAPLCRGAADFVDRFSAVRGDLDAAARALLVSRLRAAAEFKAGTLKPTAVFERLENLADGMRVGASGPIPGSLHLSSWRTGGFSGRPVTFLVGLDQGTFPGAGIQDPVLLDEEREKISASLGTSAEALRENLWAMAGMLAGLRGRVTLSFSSYDIIEERPSFPSSLILQAARLLAGDRSLDYSALARLIPEAHGFLPGAPADTGASRSGAVRAVDETDWWLANLAPGGVLKDGLDAVKENFDLLSRGIFAKERRDRPKVGEYEGKIRVDPGEVHPLHNRDIVVSASRLEQLARCPFGYFLRYVLEVSPPEGLERDQARWLGALDRGALLHDIFAGFMRAVKKSGEKGGVRAAKHAPVMKQVTDEVIRRYLADIPPPSECVFEQERKEIEQAAAVFLKSEEEREDRGEPLLFEVSFGCGKGRGGRAAAGGEERLEEPAVLDFGGGRALRLAGRIDRVDRVGPGLYRVIDYKTGSYSKFEEVKRFGKGRALQPALYAVAAEQILRKLGIDRTPRIVSSGYCFPTHKGEGNDVMVVGFDPDKGGDKFKAELKELLGLLLGALENGHFVVNPLGEGTDCEYCDYGPVCGGTAAREAAKAKKDANPEVFELFEKLKDYD
ncbi:MAG: hypothetical protein A2W03_04660 [Candidatus Aminicenantes bacterium RBG_16_63_16]|nr:MAG: hypothetical protein A2W03_04660 [Candidatus Aminicenantes bacterium RBG_16_63_16]